MNEKEITEIEKIKESSNYLRGKISEDFNDPITSGVTEESKQLLKFHGMYLQDDRELRSERRKQKLENYYQFMIRVRAPGGIISPAQWLVIDRLANDYSSNGVRLTTRQSFQFHGIWKRNVRKVIKEINRILMDSFAACGDVNRNVMCNPNPYQSEIHKEVYEWSASLSEFLTPRSKAYHEIWLDRNPVISSDIEQEPIYGKTYLPRKFKIAIAVPPSNDVDVLAHDLGFIAIIENSKLTGFNVSAGGGMGMTHGETGTYPRLGDIIGFCRPDEIMAIAEKVLLIQKDFGSRTDRKHARLKYTIDDRGLEWFKKELFCRLGKTLDEPMPFHFEHNHDRYGWGKGINDKWNYTFFIQNGRIKDFRDFRIMSGIREIARIHKGDFRLTPNQNLIIGNIDKQQKNIIESLIRQYQLDTFDRNSGVRLNSMACVALPTCGLAMAESERYLPDLISRIERVMKEAGLEKEAINIRMTGCPNGCARPYLGEIGFVGKALGLYNIYLGAGFTGERLNKLYKENVRDSQIMEIIRPIIIHYSKERLQSEHFGDFVVRKGYVNKTGTGKIL